ncbi:MAG: hypothetical protein AAB455_00165 [Patescibacteria group bacterium]
MSVKRFGIIAVFVLTVFVSFLWLLGEQHYFSYSQPKVVTPKIAAVEKPVIRPIEDKNKNQVADWTEPLTKQKDQAVSLVLNALKGKQAPLLPIEALPATIAKEYTLADLRLVPMSDKTLTNYGTELKQAMTPYSTDGFGYEVTLLADLTPTNEASVVAGIEAATARYDETIKELLAIATPRELGQSNLNLLNLISDLAGNSRLMAAIRREPVLALGAAELQISNLKKVASAIGNINLFFLTSDLAIAKTPVTVKIATNLK